VPKRVKVVLHPSRTGLGRGKRKEKKKITRGGLRSPKNRRGGGGDFTHNPARTIFWSRGEALFRAEVSLYGGKVRKRIPRRTKTHDLKNVPKKEGEAGRGSRNKKSPPKEGEALSLYSLCFGGGGGLGGKKENLLPFPPREGGQPSPIKKRNVWRKGKRATACCECPGRLAKRTRSCGIRPRGESGKMSRSPAIETAPFTINLEREPRGRRPLPHGGDSFSEEIKGKQFSVYGEKILSTRGGEGAFLRFGRSPT